MSAFLRRLLDDYVRLPLIHREIVVHKKNYNLLNEFCKNKHVVILETKNKTYKIVPFKVVSSLFESGNYILGADLKSYKNKPIALKLNKVIQVTQSPDQYKFTKEEIEEFNKIIENGVEYATGEFINVKVKLTKSGIKMFGYMLDHKPTVINVKGDVYTLKCTVSNFMNYFSAFGMEFTILDNEELKQKMLNFFKNAYLNLEKDS